jgi:hypothetical protein
MIFLLEVKKEGLTLRTSGGDPQFFPIEITIV